MNNSRKDAFIFLGSVILTFSVFIIGLRKLKPVLENWAWFMNLNDLSQTGLFFLIVGILGIVGVVWGSKYIDSFY